MKLSILVCSVHTRRKTFLPKILDMLFDQYEALSPQDQLEVEIIVVLDNKQMMLGDKRNYLIDMAIGDYVCFVDDDDRIPYDYMQSILHAIKTNPDCITFLASVSLEGAQPKTCRYSIDYIEDKNLPDGYERIPNHICVIKKEIAEKVRYQPVIYGEDVPYAKEIRQYLNTEVHINRVLYYYDFNSHTTETQSMLARRRDRLAKRRR